MVEFKPEQLANLIQRHPEFASLVKIRYPDMVPDIVSFSLNPDCSCKKRVIQFAKKKNKELNVLASDWVEDESNVGLNLEPILKNQPAGNRKRREMNLSQDQIEFINERKKKLEEKRKNAGNNAIASPIAPSSPKATAEPTKPVVRDLAGEIIEIAPQPIAYKNMIKYVNENSWSYKGLSIIETEKIEEGTDEPKVVWLVFFY